MTTLERAYPIDIEDFSPDDHRRFVGKVVFGPGCWGWRGTTNASGYGVFYQGGRNYMAHRIAYSMWVGPITDLLTVDHLCRNRACVRPGHMELVTHRVNMLRGDTIQGRRSRVTHCPRGHIYDATNTRVTPKGQRECRKCLYLRQVRYRERRRLSEVHQFAADLAGANPDLTAALVTGGIVLRLHGREWRGPIAQTLRRAAHELTTSSTAGGDASS